jgi:hypothetical protein
VQHSLHYFLFYITFFNQLAFCTQARAALPAPQRRRGESSIDMSENDVGKRFMK